MPSSDIDPHDHTMLAGSTPVNTMNTAATAPVRRPRTWVLILVLSLVAVGTAVLVFVILSAVDQPSPPTATLETASPAPSAQALPEGVAPPEAPSTLRIVAPGIEGARIFIDAMDRGPLEAELSFELPAGTHSVEARRDDRIVAHAAVELEPGASTTATLHEGRAAHVGRAQPAATRSSPAGGVDEEPARGAAVAARPRPSEPRRAGGREPTEAQPPSAPRESAAAMTASAPAASAPAASAPAASAAASTPTPAPVAPVIVPNEEDEPVARQPVVMARPPRPTEGPTVTTATRASLTARLRELQPQVRRCVGGWHGGLDVAVTVAGERVGARVGRGPSGQQRRCVQRALVEGLRARFRGRAATRHTYRL